MWPWRKERSPAIAISSSASRRACRKKNGLQRMFDQKVDVDWSDDSLEIIKQTVLKKYCSLIHGQPVLEAVLKLKRDKVWTRSLPNQTDLPLGRYSGWNVISISPRPRLVWPWHSCHLYSRTSHDGRPHGPMVCRLRHHVHPVDGSCVNFQQDVCAGRVPNKTSKSSHSVSRRWHQRRACPNRRRQVAGEVGPAAHHREPHRRRRQHRCCRGGAGGPRWLSPAGVGTAAARHQPKPLQGVVLQAGSIRMTGHKIVNAWGPS